jgi:4a-hydroxytetrahydrobiopterin dehydratase
VKILYLFARLNPIREAFAIKFKNFARALAFVNKIGAVAEAEDHHPDLYLAWGKCRVEIWTHIVNGLLESDFYLAAKSDRVFNRMQTPDA